MKATKYVSAAFLLFFSCALLSAEMTARQAATAAAGKAGVEDSVSFLNDALGAMTVPAEKRSLYVFLGSVQEQAALYGDACVSYAAAAAIAAGDAPGMPKVTTEHIVLDAVRCALCTGDWQTADTYLNSAVRNSADSEVQAYIKLYSLWSLLCRADDSSGMEEPVALLKTYAGLSTMDAVRPQVLFTLWYLTGEDSWSSELKTQFPSSPEAGIVSGRVHILPAPFWYFVPHRETMVAHDVQTDDVAVSDSDTAEGGTSGAGSNEAPAARNSVRLQLGLFRDKTHADSFAEKIGKKGFTAYITTEKRASGTTYYIVLVDEDEKHSVAPRLRSAGFECYEY